MVLYLTIFGVFSLSGVIWLLNAESFAFAAGLLRDERLHGAILGPTLGLSQTVGFTIIFIFGQAFLARSPRLQEQVARLPKERLKSAAPVTLALAALTGVPPLLAVSALGPALGIPLPRFAAIVLVFRTIKFTALYYAGLGFGQGIIDAFGWAPPKLPF